jgi:protein gp37
MYRDEARYGQDPARVVRSKTTFNVPLKWKASQLILTKRPGCIADHLPHDWPWPHAWLGVSVETPAYRWRADALREIPAAHRFLSCEGLLEGLGVMNLQGIDWVITGGDSGP